MKKLLILALCVPMLASCVATRAAMANVENEMIALREGYTELNAAALSGATADELAALEDRVRENVESVKDATEAVAVAVKADVEGLKTAGKGILGLGAAGDATGIAGILGFLATKIHGAMRDRRYLTRPTGGPPPNVAT